MALNINRNVDDMFYRYKMPRLLAKVEGKGNGIKTVIANMPEIAKALMRPPMYATKYFGCELGAQTQFDNKNDRYIVNGEHDAAKLQDLLHGFIKKFVLCSECENPETVLTIKGPKITQSCKACGHVGMIDPRHKLTTYILKNPPDQEVADKENPSVTVGKKGKGRRGGKDQQNGGNGGETTATSADNKDAVNGSILQDANEAGKDNNSDEFEPDDWGSGEDELDQPDSGLLPDRMATLTMNADLDKSEEERLDMFYNYLLDQKKKSTSGATLDPKFVVNEAERLEVKDKGVLILCRVLFDSEPAKIIGNVKPNRPLLLRFTLNNKKAQRYLLGGLEQLVMAHSGTLLAKVPHILKAFYDEDIIEERELLEWGEKSSRKYVSKEDNKEIRAKAEPFLKWLREAEEESEDEDEDGDDEANGVEVAFEEEGRGARGAVKTTTTAAAAPEPPNSHHHQNGTGTGTGGEKDDDLNIDDI